MTDDIALPGQLSRPIWTGRGAMALISVLRQAVPQGSGVLVPVNICAIAAKAIIWAGMQPVFHDVSDTHGNGELRHLESAFLPACKVWLAVHNFGRPLPMDALMTWCRERKLIVVEDVCNALGATSGNKPVGTFGDASIYSFNAGKILELGSGGAATARDPELRRAVAADVAAIPPSDSISIAAAESLEAGLRAARLADDFDAQAKLYEAYRPKVHYRADAALGSRVADGLARLDENISHRRAIALLYRSLIVLPDVEHAPAQVGEVPWRHNILVAPDVRDRLVAHLRHHGVATSTWYPPIDRLVEGRSKEWPGADRFASRVVNLWVDSSVQPDDARTTSGLIRDFFGATA